jgi:hypothetical protein
MGISGYRMYDIDSVNVKEGGGRGSSGNHVSFVSEISVGISGYRMYDINYKT